jgi:hypothetical protein
MSQSTATGGAAPANAGRRRHPARRPRRTGDQGRAAARTQARLGADQGEGVRCQRVRGHHLRPASVPNAAPSHSQKPNATNPWRSCRSGGVNRVGAPVPLSACSHPCVPNASPTGPEWTTSRARADPASSGGGVRSRPQRIALPTGRGSASEMGGRASVTAVTSHASASSASGAASRSRRLARQASPSAARGDGRSEPPAGTCRPAGRQAVGQTAPRGGSPVPALATPDGAVVFPDIPAASAAGAGRPVLRGDRDRAARGKHPRAGASGQTAPSCSSGTRCGTAQPSG